MTSRHDKAFADVKAELERAAKSFEESGVDIAEFDSTNTCNDWIAYVNAYTGRAAKRVYRNEREGQSFRANMVKAAAVCMAAITAFDNG